MEFPNRFNFLDTERMNLRATGQRRPACGWDLLPSADTPPLLDNSSQDQSSPPILDHLVRYIERQGYQVAPSPDYQSQTPPEILIEPLSETITLERHGPVDYQTYQMARQSILSSIEIDPHPQQELSFRIRIIGGIQVLKPEQTHPGSPVVWKDVLGTFFHPDDDGGGDDDDDERLLIAHIYPDSINFGENVGQATQTFLTTAHEYGHSLVYNSGLSKNQRESFACQLARKVRDHFDRPNPRSHLVNGFQ